MAVGTILYYPRFVAEFEALPKKTQERAIKTEELFRHNPFHPSLRIHALTRNLKGSWSLSVTMKIRILFTQMEKEEIAFYSIGKHDIYRSV